MKEFLELLSKSGISCEYELDFDFSKRSTVGVGGIAKIAFYPKTLKEMTRLCDFFTDNGMDFLVLGNISNTLPPDGVFEKPIILTKKLNSIEFSGGVFVEAGVTSSAFLDACQRKGRSGAEFLAGIPCTIGGAVYMNAGAYGGAISDVIDYSIAYDRVNQRTFRIYDGDFSYRYSKYMRKSNLVCLGAVFALPYGNEAEIKEKMAQNMASRKANQPLEYPSAGSYFKRPEGHFAGKLIEDCGLKGLSVGGAQVSEKHAGFIINRGGASYSDVLALEEKIKEKVFSEFGVELEREVRVITN